MWLAQAPARENRAREGAGSGRGRLEQLGMAENGQAVGVRRCSSDTV